MEDSHIKASGGLWCTHLVAQDVDETIICRYNSSDDKMVSPEQHTVFPVWKETRLIDGEEEEIVLEWISNHGRGLPRQLNCILRLF